MKKKTRRRLKRMSKRARKAWAQVSDLLDGRDALLAAGGAATSGVLAAALADPKIRESGRDLVRSVLDFLQRQAGAAADSSLASRVPFGESIARAFEVREEESDELDLDEGKHEQDDEEHEESHGGRARDEDDEAVDHRH